MRNRPLFKGMMMIELLNKSQKLLDELKEIQRSLEESSNRVKQILEGSTR